MRGFFPMSRGDLAYVILLLGFAVVAFLPWAREVHFVGVALVGWLMALLMIVAPVVAIIRILQERRIRKEPREAGGNEEEA